MRSGSETGLFNDRREQLCDAKLFSQVVWADDLAAPLLATHNAETASAVVFASKGKTEVAVTFASHDARRFRERLRQDLPCQLRWVALQNLFSWSWRMPVSTWVLRSLHLEVKRWIGQAWSTFRQLARPIFLNKALRECARIFLLETLVFPKLLHGCGSWSGLTCADIHRLTVCYVGLLRRTRCMVHLF